MRRLPVLLAIGAATILSAAASALAQTAPAAPPTPQPTSPAAAPAPAPTPTAESAATAAARAIDQLIAGTLAGDVPVEPLFAASLRTGDAMRVRFVVAMLADKGLFARAQRDPAALAPLAADQARLAVAQARFLRLPPAQRRQLLDRHAAKAAAQAERAGARSEREREAAALRAQIGQLEAFLAGKPAGAGALALDLLAGAANLAAAPPSPGTAPDSPAGLRARRADLLRQILALPPDRRAALEQASGVDVPANAAAQAAERKAEAARRAAETARSERERILASERAKLLAVQAAQARFGGALAAGEAAPADIQENALGWRRRVRDIEALTRTSRAPQADALYPPLVAELQDIRQALRRALGAPGGALDAELLPPAADEAIASGLVGDPALARLRAELVANGAGLRARHEAARAQEQKALRDAMVLVNDARLELIPYLNGAKRSAVLGFGREGIGQVRREVAQISLDLRYSLVNWRQGVDSALLPFRQPTPSFAFALLALIVAALGFRWWRRRGGLILLASERALRDRRPRTLATEAQATFFSYVRRIGAAFDWMAFLLLLRWLVPESLQPASLPFIWIVATYSVAAWFMARLTNELVRGRRKVDPRAELRLRSLGLAIGVSFVVLLVLALTRESVGKGAIYNWVLSFCWLLALPVVLLLAHWWRERIVALAAAAAERSAFLGWVARDPDGPLALAGRAAAGALLLIEGARVAAARRIRDFGLVRELFEHRERALAARQVAEDMASGRYRSLPEATMAMLDPHRAPAGPARLAGAALAAELDQLPGGAIGALVGERGLGKSAVLLAVLERRRERGETIVSLQLDQRGYPGLLAGLGAALCGARAKPDETRVAEALAACASDAPVTIAVDDLQRLIVPAIGGLEALDRLVALARRSSPSCSWFMAMGAPAWNYVSRARFDRVLFDKVCQLPRWPVDDLRALIERRTEQAGITPDFDDLADTGAYRFDGDLTPEQRREAAYFERLSDYANGNPAVALEFWRRSLFEVDSGAVVVRTFATPDAAALASLPPAATFVLRAILQMDSTVQADIERSTDLSAIIVSDAIRSLERLGVIAAGPAGYRITMFWWAEVVRALQRQNLIVRF